MAPLFAPVSTVNQCPRLLYAAILAKYSRAFSFIRIPQFGFRLLPLLPDICTDSVPQPFVPLRHSLLHKSGRIVVQTSHHVELDFFHDLSDFHSAISFGQCTQFILCLQQCFGMYSDQQPLFPLAVCKAQKLEILCCVHLGDVAFLSVHLQLQFPFQIADAAFQQSFCRSLALAQKYTAYRITSTPRLSYSLSNAFRYTSPIIVTAGRPADFLPSWRSLRRSPLRRFSRTS